ncbi:MAG: cbb3-type cytochrome oxidase assembly protein CcoS [Acidobacteriota bacterium]|nr:cbb3-type cytochrome oxidase assembly protein CcoS [Acidobacteriota bacterium]
MLLFAWAVRRGQFDDLETPALRMLDDDDSPIRGPAATVPPTRAPPPGTRPRAALDRPEGRL